MLEMRVISYRELMERRRRERAKAMLDYARIHGLPWDMVNKIVQAYLDGKITYAAALDVLYRLAKEKKKP